MDKLKRKEKKRMSPAASEFCKWHANVIDIINIDFNNSMYVEQLGYKWSYISLQSIFLKNLVLT